MKITLTLSDKLAQRLSYLADYYDADIRDMLVEMLTDTASICEDAIACEACEQIAWLAQVEPAGRA
jgi:predicted transcriptional regulator